ncbi:MAG TPA: PilZ domain-containing protein [Kofleriaceae bacterium]|nr:PilZ domain-containing protein [Kofleriaceae bacterium]
MKQADHVTATIVRPSRESGAFAVRDLSPGGARLVGPLDLFEGELVQLTLELDEPLTLGAEVSHVDRQRKVVEVAFRGVTEAALARIEHSIAEMLERVQASAPTVLIVHPAVDVSSALERDLARVRVAARVCVKLDELFAVLGDKTVRFIGVIVAGSFGNALGPVLQELEEKRGDLRRVILFGDQIEKIEHPAANRVDAVLRTPWRFKGLARGLGVPAEDVVTTYDQLVALNMEIGVKKSDS